MLANIITSCYILGMYEISRYLGIITQHVLLTSLRGCIETAQHLCKHDIVCQW